MDRPMYFVETKQRSYNSVNDYDHFQYIVRANWGDDSPIVHAWRWTARGWIEVTETWR